MIPLVYPLLGNAEQKIVSKIIKSRQIASGKYVEQFEKKSALFSGTKYAVATSNGTTALHAALLASGIKCGDKVITTPFSFIATSNSILHCNAEPVFADIDPVTFNLSPEKTEQIIKKNRNIRAILVVHLYGTPADMDAFLYLKKKYKLVLIEDCAQAHGAEFKNKVVGSFGDASCFSYYATKNITTGEGGMILTNNYKIERLSRQIINHGRDGHSVHTILGYNYRLTNIAAGIGIEQLNKLNTWNEKRLSNAKFLNSKLKTFDFIKTPVISNYTKPVFHQYTIRINSKIRDAFIKHLSENGIGCGIYYPYAIYRQPVYQKLGYKAGICPEAEKASQEVLSLPVHPALKQSDLNKIIKVISDFKIK